MLAFLMDHWAIWLEAVALMMLGAVVFLFRPTASNVPHYFAQQRWTLQHAIGWLLLFSLVLALGSGLQVLRSTPYGTLITFTLFLALLISYSGLLVFYLSRSPGPVPLQLHALRPHLAKGCTYALWLVLASHLLLFSQSDYELSTFFVSRYSTEIASQVTTNGFLWGGLVGVLLPALLMNIAIPLYEELLYRGLLYGALRKHFQPPMAMVISTAFFTLGHDHFLFPVLLGLITTSLVEKSHSIIPGFVTHLIWNLSILMLRFEASTSLLSHLNYLRTVIIFSMVGLLAIFLGHVFLSERQQEALRRAGSSAGGEIAHDPCRAVESTGAEASRRVH